MSYDSFAEFMKSAEQALEYERGPRASYRVTRVVVPSHRGWRLVTRRCARASSR